ncbi:MAG: aminoglycoside phosphotransferase, partial [Ruminococcus sp.]|nr:aminoglycoside phosphotransferase [Ruminococcus sp.]
MNLDRVIAVRNTKTVYRDGDKCIKVFNSSYKKSRVLNEALNQSIVEETGIKMPKLIEVLMIDGKWSVVSEYISGKTIAQLISEDPSKKREYIEKMVDIQLEIHSKTCPMLRKL